jgi:hypothetical protein
MKLKHKKLLKHLIACAVLLVLIIVLLALRQVEFVAEYVFSRGVSRAIITVMGTVTNVFPFSIFEVLASVAILCLIIFIIRAVRNIIKRKHFKAALGAVKVLTVTLCVLLVYISTASFAYFRAPVNFWQTDALPSDNELVEIVHSFIDDFNDLGARLGRDESGFIKNPYNFNCLSQKMHIEFEKLQAEEFGGYFNRHNSRPKRFIYSRIFAGFNISGMAFLPTGEAHINRLLPPTHVPYLMAHEIAHTKGVMWESDAELVAAYVLLTSDNEFLRYSGYMAFFWHLRFMLLDNQLADEHNYAVFTHLCSEIFNEMHLNRDFYSQNYGKFREIGRFFNDLYLRLSGAGDGVGSYFDPSDSAPQTDADGNPILGEDDKPIIRVVRYGNIEQMLLFIAPQR